MGDNKNRYIRELFLYHMCVVRKIMRKDLELFPYKIQIIQRLCITYQREVYQCVVWISTWWGLTPTHFNMFGF